MAYKLEKKIGSKRIGRLETKSGVAKTPFFMPIATQGSIKSLSTDEVKQIGFEVVLGNTYHLWLRPGDELVKSAGGLHTFMNWNKNILTDSGGFQVFSLGEKAKERFGKSGVKLSEEGVEFVDPENGKKYFMTPEKSVEIQINLGSDIIMCLDECPPYPCDYDYAKSSLELTTRWAQRCKNFLDEYVAKNNIAPGKRPLLFAIVQGSVYEDLRKESAEQLLEIGFDGYAVGGVAVGEPREKMKEILQWVLPLLPEDKPRYLMGLGKPEELVSAIKTGIDMFDCVIPTREGRHGRLFVWKDGYPEKNLSEKDDFYETINIKSNIFQKDFEPLSKNCGCQLCANYSRAYLRHLFAVNELLALRLASIHNLNFYYQLIEKMREDGI